jgi:hypothetical protein
LRFARIAYPWYPLFGRTLRVAPHRRGKDLRCIYTDERPDLSRELPNWMFDESYCARMALGPPQISIGGLNKLAAVLASFGANRKPAARCRSSKTKEDSSAEKAVSKSGSVGPRAGASKSSTTIGAQPKGARRSSSGPSIEGPGRGYPADRRHG